MSILIKGMDMPYNCAACPLRNQEFFKGKKYLYGCCLCKGWGTGQTRADDCTLVEVPTPHGRLIDADALTKALEKRWNVDDDQDFANKSVWRELENAPTIVEAEGKP